VKPRKLNTRQGKASVILFAVPGAGKTRLIAGGKKTLIIRPPSDHVDSVDFDNDCEEIVVENWAEMFEAEHYVMTEGWKKFDWVWLDSLSLFQDYGLADVLDDAIARKPERAIEKGGLMVVEHGPDKGEYRTNMDRVAKFVREMQALAEEDKFHFGMTAHPFEWYDPVRDDDVWAPWIQGKNMIPKICGYMNMVLYLETKNRKGKPPAQCLYSQAEGIYGKDQYQCFPELKSGKRGLVNPTMTKLTAAIEGSTGKRSPRGGRRKRTNKRRS